jgi:uncharacterized protein YegL
MENQLTEIICILDRSGSMQSLQEETVKGLNAFMDQQRTEFGRCNFSLVQFNHEVKLSVARVPVKLVERFSLADYKPFGYTALYDAIGETLNQATRIFNKLEGTEKPAAVLVYIITDGQENASRSYNASGISRMIEQLSATGIWSFEFFAANINTFASAQEIGIKRENATSWAFDVQGVDLMSKDMCKKASMIRAKSLRSNQK